MNQDNTDTNQVGQRWFIDLNWYQQNNRSFVSLAREYLCSKCREELHVEVSAAELLKAINDCCSKTPDFITGQLPVLDSIFRLFLANGNQPLDLEEVGKQLSGRRGGNIYRTSAKILSRLLNGDRYYGIRPISPSDEEQSSSDMQS